MNQYHKIGFAILFLAIIFVCGTLIWLMTAEKRVVGYYLTGTNSQSRLEIGVDIENNADQYIPLIGISYDSAVNLVNRLNYAKKREKE